MGAAVGACHLSEYGADMTRGEIKDVILEIIADIDEDADMDGLNADEPLRDQLDLDSMDFLDIVMELRKRYKLQIPESDYPELATLTSCINYLEPKLGAVAK
jgi:acyl carrier protein